MRQIPEFNIETTEEETRTNLPGPALDKLEPWLRFHKIDYKVVKGDDIPDEWIQGWHFKGRTGVRNTVVVVSKLNSIQLHQAAEDLDDCTMKQIEALI